MKLILLAGGSGQRLWPYSRKNKPKQFLSFGKNSLFQKALNRFKRTDFIDDIIIATNEKYKSLFQEQLDNNDCSINTHFVYEPTARNTMPAIALALKYVQENISQKDEKFLVVSTDQDLYPESNFLQSIEKLNKVELDDIVIFGVNPTAPKTGYGYIKTKKIDAEDLLLNVMKFVEKPNIEKAKEYISQNNYFWNIGMFLFRSDLFIKEMKEHQPEMFEYYSKDYKYLYDNFGKLPNISIDYALLEKTKKIKMHPLNINWTDLGSWESVYEHMKYMADRDDNVKLKDVVTLDTKRCFIKANKKKIVALGLEDIVVVDTDDVLFLAKKKDSQKVKEVLQKLENEKEHDLL